jgi:hypothetical protein
MKGMMDLLEKAGLVRRVGDAETPMDEPVDMPAPEPLPEAAAPLVDTAGMTLEQVYAAAGVPACAYPAERLLRLLDGLKAMDEATRRQTIQAIDAADDSWTLDDPKRDAQAKVAAIEAHSASIRSGVAQAEQEAQAQLRAQMQAQETSVAEIRRQISELEGLLAREIARGAQENAALEASLQATRESANRELTQLARSAGALTGLIAQLGSNTSH